jgi:hypothetical protein
MKKLLAILILALGIVGASNPPFAGPNNGQVTVTNSSTVITPVPFPGRFSINFWNNDSAITIYICQATQKDTNTGFPSATLKTCSSSVADIVLLPKSGWGSFPNDYTGQYTAITSSSTATLVINEK